MKSKAGVSQLWWHTLVGLAEGDRGRRIMSSRQKKKKAGISLKLAGNSREL